MTLKFKSFSENSVLQMTTEENVPFVTQKMFNQLEFFDRLKKHVIMVFINGFPIHSIAIF